MIRPRSSLLVAIPLLVLALAAGTQSLGPLPPLGALLDPAQGAWALAARAEHDRDTEARIAGLAAPVRVVYDDRGVPHIFAASEPDALRAFGWVVARDRLFQLEVQARAGGGRLTELVGALGLGVDREARALGLSRAAERKLGAIERGGAEWRVLEAYAQGVNSWIDAMRPADLPLEYRLLGTRPARWEPIHSLQLLGRMGWTLALSDHELVRMRARSLVGREAADALFPIHAPIQEPIQPNGRPLPRDDFRPLPPPGEPEPADVAAAHALDDLMPPLALSRHQRAAGDALGSNNWAVAGSRTRDGHVLLAGDPHLELTLPSIWYEAHLVVPGALDVYGVTIPGAPMIVIGFTRDIAWTFTNSEADVLDLWRETVDDASAPSRYLVDDEWRTIELRIEQYRDAVGRLLATDTLRFTHRGPLRRIGPTWVSSRWTVLEPGREIEAFLGVVRATTTREFLAVTAGYRAPAQNMLVADRGGSIAIRSTGRFPLRAGDGRGDVIRDGSRSSSDWVGDWPLERHPQAIDPPQGFLASANQQPIDPRADAGYLRASWPAPWRATRINQLLRANDRMTPDAMARMQTDPGSARADRFVPAFVAAARASASLPDAPRLARAAALLESWDRRYTPDNDRAVLFEYAMSELASNLWDELRSDGSRASLSPGDAIIAQLLEFPESAWWDDRLTGERETRDRILSRSLADAYARAVRMHGEPGSDEWTWSRRRHARIEHLLRLPALSAPSVPVQGGPSTLSPSSGSGRFGASWRMVVELGPEVRAWGIYPGGQSGNPVSARYRDGIASWREGRLDTLRYPREPADVVMPTANVTLRPSGSGR